MDTRFPCGHRTLAVLLWGLSFSLLAYEVVLLRILTYLQWYHFAYLIISLALLGFGASGTLLHLFRPFWRRHLGGALTGAFFLTGITLAANRPLLAVIPMDSFLAVLQPWQLVWLVLLGLMLFLPFFFGAFALILVFAAAPRRIALYYGANLLGSGAGALGGLLLLYRWHPLDIPPLLGLLTGLLGVVLVINAGQREGRPWAAVLPPSRLAWGLAGLGAIVLLGWGGMSRAQMSPYKALSRTRLMPGIEVLLERSDPLGVLTIIRGPTLRSAAGLSFAYQGDIWPQPVAYLDGNPLGPLPLLDDPSATDALRHACFALPYRIRSFTANRDAPRRVLVLNAGPGIDVQHALVEGAGSVIAVERQRGLIHALGRLDDGAGGPPTVYRHPQVEVVVTEPRHFLYGDTTHYDVVVLPPMGGVISASAGMEAVAENYLLTVEGMTAMVDRLSPGGLLCASVWLDTPLRRPLKLFGLMAAALEAHGPENGDSPGSRLAAIGSWNLMTVVLSRRPWSPKERERIIAFASREGFDLHYLPGVEETPAGSSFHQLADTTLAPGLAALAEGVAGYRSFPSPFHLAPPTDDRPFFNHLLTLRSLPVMRRVLGTEGFLLAEWGYVLVWITLALLAAGGVLLILMPLGLVRRARRRDPSRKTPVRDRPLGLLYFGAIGGGFMFLEILLIQKMVLVLGDPLFAVSAVIAALLVFAGVGSMLSGRLPARWLVPGGAALVILMLGALAGGLSFWASAWATWGMGGRFVTVIAALAPLGLIMGVFFPAGIRRLEATRSDQLIPWAWGINGLVSVVTTPVATLVALNLGFRVVGLLGIGCYLLAAATFIRREGSVRRPGVAG